MKVLTLYPEWAMLVLSGKKKIENRSWGRDDVIGRRIAIHAGAPLGQIVCTAIVKEILTPKRALEKYPRQEEYIDDTPGNLCWVLSDVKPVEPVVVKGKLGLWTIPDDQLVTVK